MGDKPRDSCGAQARSGGWTVWYGTRSVCVRASRVGGRQRDEVTWGNGDEHGVREKLRECRGDRVARLGVWGWVWGVGAPPPERVGRRTRGGGLRQFEVSGFGVAQYRVLCVCWAAVCGGAESRLGCSGDHNDCVL